MIDTNKFTATILQNLLVVETAFFGYWELLVELEWSLGSKEVPFEL